METVSSIDGHFEIELLLLLSKPHLDERDCERIRHLLALERLNWDLMAQLSGEQGLATTAWKTLTSKFSDQLRMPVVAPFSQVARSLAKRKIALLEAFLQFDERLKTAGINYIAFKGPSWTSLAYNGDLFARQFIDIDIFLERPDLKKLCTTLIQEGFSIQYKPKDMPLNLILDWSHGVNIKRGMYEEFDLHYRLQPFSYLPISNLDIWNSTVELDVLGTKVKALSDELQVIAHCAHATKGLWQKAIWSCDLAHLIASRPDFDWDKVFAVAKKLHVQRSVTLGLQLAGRLMDAEIPKAAQCSDPELLEMVDRLAQFHTPASDLQRWQYRSKLADSWPGKIAPALEVLFMPKADNWARFRFWIPAQLSCMYYIVHPCFKLYIYAKKLARRAGLTKS